MANTADVKKLLVICSSVDQVAATLVETLRQKLQPPPSDTQYSARLRDASLPATERQRAFSELLARSRRDATALDAAALDAITTYIGSLAPDQRAQGLQRLHNIKQPALVTPLLNFLQHDADEKVRLEALSTLITDYASDNRVLAALESVARQDASRFVRMAAQRPLSGDAPWQGYVLEMLADKGLPATQRLAPVIYGMRSVTDAAAYEKANAALASELVTSQLLDIFQELRGEVRAAAAGTDLGSSQDNAMRNILTLLSATNPAAALDLQIRILEDPLPHSSVTTQALLNLIGKRDDPRVSKVLDDIAAGKSGPELRNTLERETVNRNTRGMRPF